MKILFTGSRSLAGREYFDRLGKAGYDVIGVSRVEADQSIRVDLADPDLASKLPDERFDVLIHCAATVPLDERASTWEECAPVNVHSTVNLLRWAENRVSRIILVSSCAVYGGEKLYTPTDEHHPLHPDTAYAMTKYAQEQIVHAFCFGRNLPLAIMRLGYVYGPGMNAARAVVALLRSVKEGKKITLRNPDTAGLHLIHTSDIARIGAGLLTQGSGVFNVVTPQMITLREYVETAVEVVGKRVEIETTTTDPKITNFYSSRLGEVGLLPTVSLKDGIASLLSQNGVN